MAHEFAERTGRFMIPKFYILKQWLRHVYHVLETNGMSRKDSIIAHGRRHEYANDLFETLTGEPTGVRGGTG